MATVPGHETKTRNISGPGDVDNSPRVERNHMQGEQTMVSTLLIRYLMKLAVARHGPKIDLAGDAKTWRDCVTVCNVTHTIVLWYNTPDNNTHIIVFRKQHKEDV